MIANEDMTVFFSANDQFSNWFISDFQVKGVRFNCVEQFMMYCKAKLFGDNLTADKILATANPRDQKALGRRVAGYDDTVWCERRSRIVALGCYAKFSQNSALRDALLSTGSTVLVEASPYDRIWGVGLAENDPRVFDPSQWQGQNLLGIALTEARKMLTAELSVAAVSDYTGIGKGECRKALVACDNDPLVACGYLHYLGCAVNLNGQDAEAWTLRQARDYARLLTQDETGRICHAPPPSPKNSGPRMG